MTATHCPELPVAPGPTWLHLPRSLTGPLSLNQLRLWLQQRASAKEPRVALSEMPAHVQRDIDGMGYATPGATLARERARFDNRQALARYLYY